MSSSVGGGVRGMQGVLAAAVADNEPEADTPAAGVAPSTDSWNESGVSAPVATTVLLSPPLPALASPGVGSGGLVPMGALDGIALEMEGLEMERDQLRELTAHLRAERDELARRLAAAEAPKAPGSAAVDGCGHAVR